MADPPGTTSAQETCLACILCMWTVTPGIGLCLSSGFSVSWAQIWTRLYFWNMYMLWSSSFWDSHRPCSSQESFPAKAFFQPASFSSLECNPGDNIFHARGETILERASSRQGLFPATSLFQAGTFSSPVQFPALLRSPKKGSAGWNTSSKKERSQQGDCQRTRRRVQPTPRHEPMTGTLEHRASRSADRLV